MAKTAVCFWGITRYSQGTIQSIRKNILKPASYFGEFKVFCHFFNLKKINNKRSGENISLTNDWHLFKANKLIIEEPNLFVNQYLPNLKNYGDAFNDNYKSIINLLHSLYSLKKVFQAVSDYDADSYIFVRPDLIYFDSIEKYIYKSLNTKKDKIFLPAWQSHSGYNDRFSICSSKNAAIIYSHRIDYIMDFCKERQKPLHSESLLKFVIEKSACNVFFIDTKAARVRANKKIIKENFKIPKKLILNIFLQNIFLIFSLLKRKTKKFLNFK